MIHITKASASMEVSEREARHRELAWKAACESVVLLKNEGALPLQGKKLALYGAGAAHTVKGGTGSGEVNERYSVNIRDGLRDRGYILSTENWLRDYEEEYTRLYAAFQRDRLHILKKIGKKSLIDLFMVNFPIPAGRRITEEDLKDSGTDQCVYVLSRQAGEGGDRRKQEGDDLLTEVERENIRLCADYYEHFVLLINSGAPLDMSFLRETPGIDAILYLCQLGEEGGHAVADLLSGAVTPSGKLADTWAKRYEDIPFASEYSYLNGNLRDEDYREGIYVGYRYFDSFGVEPLYPFGFGLSYTAFSVDEPAVTLDGTEVSVCARVKNIGERFAGREVLQLYVSAPKGRLDKEYQRLAAFAKTPLLLPGEDCTVELRFDLAEMASYEESTSCFILESGDYLLRLGTSSRNTAPIAILTLEGEAVVSEHEAICPCRKRFSELHAPDRAMEGLPDLPHLKLSADAFQTICYSYAVPEIPAEGKAREFVDGLTLKEMIEILVGTSMRGDNHFDLPGSVGNTTSKFWKRGLANVAMCDGPAGLRIQRVSARDRRGKIRPMELALSPLAALPDALKKPFLGNKKKDTLLYQFATAFPVAAALAQSWDTDLLREIGGAIFEEMKEFGCSFWLAPAMNIHRNPLCGRNFEYFSEDPLLTGKMAAAICRGVQQEPGYYVTIKHLACNNQEENRNAVSSNVSERALREIYLRGFVIAVREGKARAVMTSYNRLNGVYTPNSYDLCTRFLRNECGFDGVVMTDWFSTSPGHASSALAIQAGNDLIMPGGASFQSEIFRGVRSGKVSEPDVKRSCCRVVERILESQIQRDYIGK